MELTKDILKEIIEHFANEGRIFSNEAQFQFELAWALREYKDKKGNKLFSDINDKIMLEHLSIVENEKMYTDIVVRVGKKYYPIELKYKTADKVINYRKGRIQKTTFCQGAHDDASYDFLKDIQRIERVVIKKKFTPFDDEIDSKKIDIKRGFAIIISNEPKIWGRGVKDISRSPWREFFLFTQEENNPDRIIEPKKYGWVNKANGEWLNKYGSKSLNETKKERNDPLEFHKDHTLEWLDYMRIVEDDSDDSLGTLDPFGYQEVKEGKSRNIHPFKYIIVEISN